MAEVAVIIVNYKTGHLVAENIDRIFSSVGDPGLALRLIIVDNASPDDSWEILSSARRQSAHQSRITLLQSPRNGGFSHGNNLALEHIQSSPAAPDYLFFLNPDAFPQRRAIDELVAFSSQQGDGCIVGCTLLDEGHVEGNSAFRFPGLVSELQRGASLGVIDRLFPNHRICFGVPDGPVSTDWVTGAGFLMSFQLFRQLGPLDDGFFLYFEEVDYMRRARRSGVEIYTLPSARIVHLAGASTQVVDGGSASGRMPDYWYESWHRYFYKNHSRAYAFAAGWAWLIGRSINNCLAVFLPRRRVRDGHSASRFFRKAMLGR